MYESLYLQESLRNNFHDSLDYVWYNVLQPGGSIQMRYINPMKSFDPWLVDTREAFTLLRKHHFVKMAEVGVALLSKSNVDQLFSRELNGNEAGKG